MSNAEAVQVIKSCSDLMGDLFNLVFLQSELSAFKVCKEVSTTQILHHYVKVILILEDILQLNDIWVLANLEDLNLTPY